MAGSQASKRYLRRTVLATLVYLVAVFVTFHVLYHGRLPMPAALGLAAKPSVPIVALLVIIGLYLKEEKDDFQRELFIQALLWGSGSTLALTSFWSFVHLFAHFPPTDGFHVFVLFWLSTGLAAAILRRRYRSTDE